MISITIQQIDNAFLVAATTPEGSHVTAHRDQADAVTHATSLINNATFVKEN